MLFPFPGRRQRGARCLSKHYAAFLRRRVRCKKRAAHFGAHRYTTLDEDVSWN
jgi:hypothetical protein